MGKKTTQNNIKWIKNLCSDSENDWIDNVTLEKTTVYKKQKKWTIYITSKDYIETMKIKMLQKRLEDKIKYIDKINIRVNYNENIVDFINQNFNQIWVDIMENSVKDIPSCAAWLNYCHGVIQKNELYIVVSHATGLEFLKFKNFDLYIKNWFNTNFNYSMPVIIKIDEKVCIEQDTKDYIKERDKETLNIITEITSKDQSKISSCKSKDTSDKEINIIYGKNITEQPISISSVNQEKEKIVIEGQVFDIEAREIKGQRYILIFDITDFNDSITCKLFCGKNEKDIIVSKLQKDSWVKIKGECQYDLYQREEIIMVNSAILFSPKERQDTAQKKRIELHLHTQLSAMDATASPKELVKTAAKWGHPAVAITDHGVVQAFPEAYDAGKKYGIKIIYGVEAYLINDCKPLIVNGNDGDFNQTFVVLDIETTGLNERNDQITEIGAVKIKNKEIIDTFQTLVNPGIPIPPNITNLTGITDEMVKDAPGIDEVMPLFKEFYNDAALVAHNANFDIGFIKEKAKSVGIVIDNPIVDTLTLSRELLKDLKRYKLDLLAKHLGIRLDNHHRALDDATATGEILIKFFDMLEARNIYKLNDINTSMAQITNLNGLESNHAVILVKNYTGLRNLYILVSKAHLNYFYRRPRIPKSLFLQYREGLIIGSGCEAGELYKSLVKGTPYNEIRDIVNFYDYLEIQPLGNNEYLIRDGQVKDLDSLKNINRKIVELGEKFRKPVVATGDVHFLNPSDEYYRRILMNGQGFSDADHQPPLYFKTTQEMLEEFGYLGDSKSEEVVIHNPGFIAEEIENIKPIPDELHPPEIIGAEEEIASMARLNAHKIYGEHLPNIVNERLEKELHSIINNGFAVLYLIAHKLVKKSLSDGYLVGSRGSVGSSFVATMTGITEVNSLSPHYVCPNCKHSDFDIDITQYGCGVDLPDKECPVCGTQYKKNGFDIPFEVFLGFKGDKVPDIDLNFSGDYQPVAHKYTEEIFGEGHVFRAGTIGTIAEKTAFGFVKKYLDEKGIHARNAEIKRLTAGCTGVKRTTGQHPGGVMVVPKKNEIFEFTPIQYPADAKDSGIITTHFDYHSISSRLVKLDILGHDDPTVIRMLEDLTGIDAKTIPIGEKKTMKLFSSTESLGISPDDINSQVGTFGIPEFGTRFVRQMLVDTKPTTFAELIRISGLSHGTDVWLNNAQDLIKDGIAGLSEVICTRDDIMIYLIYKGLEPTIAFKIMESVRKGKGLTPEFEEKMKEKSVPEWFISSCKKIKYMFPKAHAAAYVIMAFRIAYFKVYYPEAFYATYFTVRADEFDLEIALKGREAVFDKIKELEAKGNEMTVKEKGLLTVLEIILEMNCRGIKILPVDLYKSDAVKFIVTEHGIRPPLSSLEGIGINAANSIVKAREETQFISVEDLRQKTNISKNVIEILKKHNALDDLPESSQISLFSVAFDTFK